MRVIRALLTIAATVVVSIGILWAFVRFSQFYDRSHRRAVLTLAVAAGLAAAALILLVGRYGMLHWLPGWWSARV